MTSAKTRGNLRVCKKVSHYASGVPTLKRESKRVLRSQSTTRALRAPIYLSVRARGQRACLEKEASRGRGRYLIRVSALNTAGIHGRHEIVVRLARLHSIVGVGRGGNRCRIQPCERSACLNSRVDVIPDDGRSAVELEERVSALFQCGAGFSHRDSRRSVASREAGARSPQAP